MFAVLVLVIGQFSSWELYEVIFDNSMKLLHQCSESVFNYVLLVALFCAVTAVKWVADLSQLDGLKINSFVYGSPEDPWVHIIIFVEYICDEWTANATHLLIHMQVKS